MKKLLVIRNDKLGDFILILPALRLIKTSFPNIHIDCLINESNKEIAELSNDIDDIICDGGMIKHEIMKRNYDFSISFFSTFRIGYILNQCKIDNRYAPATKIAQIFYNKKLKQNRSKSLKPEYEYNIDLAKFFLEDNNKNISDSKPPYLSIANNIQKNEKQLMIYVHPYTGGSSKCLSSIDTIKLCKEIEKFHPCVFMLHCDKYDYDKCKEIQNTSNMDNMNVIRPTESLYEMCSNINQCDIFIAGSTGPLHVAGALNKKTVGLYPSKISSTSLRWKTINNDDKSLSFENSGDDNDYLKIDINSVASIIFEKLIR